MAASWQPASGRARARGGGTRAAGEKWAHLVALDKGRLADAAVANQHELELGHRLRAGDQASGTLGDREAILVMVDGKAQITAGRDWGILGDRMNVFEKTPPHCLYLPGGDWAATATTDCTIAICTAPRIADYPAAQIGPAGIALTPRGQGANLRHINNIAMEGRDIASSLLVTEVFTPAGNWSSYPSHRHDEDDFPRMTYLEETY